MASRKHLFTSESVSMGHPDKVADQISDAILDQIFLEEIEKGNELSGVRVACETLCTTGQVIVAGEVRTDVYVDILDTVRATIKSIGYFHHDIGFSYDSCGVLNAIHSQSADIARGVDHARDAGAEKSAEEEGAGDQGMMFGFACRETEDLMPLPIWLSHRIVEKQAELRANGTLKYLRPDAKSQVTVEYDNGKPTRVHTVVMSTQHDETILKNEVVSDAAKKEMIEKIIKPCIPAEYLNDTIIYHVNPTGRFIIGGPHGDTGLTGRKIIVDTYGGRGRHGGGAFSGKDPSKVDRSAAYMSRYVAKNIVAAGLAAKCEIQFAYAIGHPNPVSVHIDTFGTGVVTDEQILKAVARVFSFKPADIVKQLDLLRPIYSKSTNYGHFGKDDADLTWERTDKIDALEKAVGK